MKKKTQKKRSNSDRVITGRKKISAWLCVVAACAFSLSLIPLGKIATDEVKGDVADYTLDARGKFDFNSGWRFCKGQGYTASGSSYTEDNQQVIVIADGTEVYANDYVEDEKWVDVSLPHTYNDTDTFDRFVEGTSSGGYTMNGERTMYAGTAWYKKTFFVPQDYAGKNIYVEFEAARQSAHVWLNGVSLDGTSLSGFIPFGYDLTPNIIVGAENTITVLCDNSFPFKVATEDGSATGVSEGSYALPWHDSHWHPNYGGLYRNSFLYVMNKLQLTLPLYSFIGGEGTYVYTSNENGSAKTAKINIDAQIANNTSESQTFDVYARVKDVDGVIVGSALLSGKTLAAGLKTTANIKIDIANVKRWSPDYPYLYTVECAVIQGGNVIDNNTNEIGVRTFRATTDGGFIINENYLYLEGWGQKTTMEWAGVGAAYPYDMTEYVIKQMKDAGANYIRWGHVAGSADQIKICDRLGVIVTQPGVDGEGDTGTYKYTAATVQIRLNSMRDMVIYYRNSPSILLWELANQSTIGSAYSTIFENLRLIINTYDYGGRNSDGTVNNYGTKAATAGKDASTRLCTVRRPSTSIKSLVEVSETTDLDTDGLGLPKLEGEYNRYETRRGFWDNLTEGFENYKNIASTGNSTYANFTGESVALYQVERYNTMESKGLAHMGGANWIYSDSTSHARLLSEVSRTTGEVDATMLEKDSYYTTRVLYSDNIYTHIIGHWNYDITKKTVYVVSKAAKVTLSVTHGGVTDTYSNYTKNTDKYGRYLFVFSNVNYYAGTITAKGYGADGLEISGATDSIVTAGNLAALKITRAVTTGNIYADGSSYVLLDIEAVDAAGNRLNAFDGQVKNSALSFSLSSTNQCCAFRGGYNSSREYSVYDGSTGVSDYTLYLEAGITRIALRVGKQSGSFMLGTSMTYGGTTYTASFTADVLAPLNGVTSGETACNYSTLTQKSYSLEGLTEPSYGSQTAPDDSTPTETESNKFVSSAECLLGQNDISIAKMQSGAAMYSDTEDTFVYIPSEYVGAEYVLGANSRASVTSGTIYNVGVACQCTAFVLIRTDAAVPSWVTDGGFTKTDKTVTASNGTFYACYEKPAALGETISAEAVSYYGSADSMYILGFTCGDVSEAFSSDAAISKYDGSRVSTLAYDATNDALHLCETSATAEYIVVPIKGRTGVYDISFDYMVSATSVTKYARVFLQKDGAFDNLGVPAAFRLFFQRDGDSVVLSYNLKKNSTELAVPTTNYSITAGAFYTYKITVDTVNNTVMAYYGEVGSNTFNALFASSLAVTNISAADIDHLVFSTGGSTASDVYVKNLAVKSQSAAAKYLSGITVRGQSVNFNESTHFYYMGETSTLNPLPSQSEVTATVINGATASVSVKTSEKRVTIIVTATDYSAKYILSYSDKSELPRGTYYFGLYGNQSGVTPSAEELYVGSFMYKVGATFSGVPVSLCGADVFYVSEEDFSSRLYLSARYASYLFIITREADAPLLAVNGEYSDFGVVLPLSDGTRAKVMYKLLSENESTEIGYKYFDNLGFTSSVAVAIKSVADVTSENFFSDDFASVGSDGMPLGWTAVSETNTSITFEESTESLIFEDTGTSTKAYINKAFSSQDGKFTLSLTIKVENTYVASYIRVVLTDGAMSGFFDNNHKDNFGVETYLHDSDTDVSNGFSIVYRDSLAASSNIELLNSIPYGQEIVMNYYVDAANHKFAFSAEYGGQSYGAVSGFSTESQSSLWKSFTTNSGVALVDEINNIGVGTGQSGQSKFHIYNLAITPEKATFDQSQVLTIDGTWFSEFDYMSHVASYKLGADNAIPTVAAAGTTLTPTITSGVYSYAFSITDNDGAVHNCTLILQPNKDALNEKFLALSDAVSINYDPSGLAALSAALSDAAAVLKSQSATPSEVASALTALTEAENALVPARKITLTVSGGIKANVSGGLYRTADSSVNVSVTTYGNRTVTANIYKTDDSSVVVNYTLTSGTYTFTMPAYAVTAQFSTDGETEAQVSVDDLITLASGASVRMTQGALNSGLRFKNVVNKEKYDALCAALSGKATVTCGMMLLPTDYLKNGADFTAEYLTANSILYVEKITNGWASTTGSQYSFYVSLVNIKQFNYYREFSARAFVQIEYNQENGGGKTRYYSSYSEADNSRSVYGVALASVTDANNYTEDQIAILKDFVDRVVFIDSDGHLVNIEVYEAAYRMQDGALVSQKAIYFVVRNGKVIYRDTTGLNASVYNVSNRYNQ